MPLTVEQSDKIPCQSPLNQLQNFSVSFPWHSSESGTLDRVMLARLCKVNLCHRVLIFYTKLAQTFWSLQFSPVQFSYSVGPDSLQPHGLQLARPPCPSPIAIVHSNSCPLSRWCHPTISSSAVRFSSCLQSFPASGSFQSISSLHQVAKVLEFQLQYQSFQWIFRTDFL